MLIGTLRTALDMEEENLIPKNEFLKRQKCIRARKLLRKFYNYFCNDKNFSNDAILHKKRCGINCSYNSNLITYFTTLNDRTHRLVMIITYPQETGYMK